LLGYGYWGPNLARNLHHQLGTGWTACVDTNPKRLAEVKFRYPWVSTFTDSSPVLADDTIDAVVVATPAATHLPLAAEALAAGKHVLVEKPLALRVEDAVRLARQAEQAERVLMVGHTFEYNPAVLKMRELVASGAVGELLYLHSQRVNLGRIQSDINAMWSIGPHDVSIANFVTGLEPRWVAARGARYLHAEVEDVVFATIGYDSGVLAHMHVSWLDPSKVRRTTMVGSKKMVVYDDLDSESTLRVYDKSADRVEGGYGEFQFRLRTGDLHVPKINLAEPLANELAHFLACVSTGATPASDAWNGVRVVAVLEAAQRSLEQDGIAVEVAPQGGVA
jgi:predicted dehydrogenase